MNLGILDTARNRSLSYDSNEFCVNGRLLPSLFGIGVQKCGTSTLAGILQNFHELSRGTKKEHHFFDHSKLDLDVYIQQFPKCNEGIVRSWDITPNYTNPSSNSSENIKRFYERIGIPLDKVVFIAMVCPNSRRVPSAFYHARRMGALNSNITSFNKWFDWILRHQDQDEHSSTPLQRGFYDDIFERYFEIFPESTFLFIDSQYAFDEMQRLGDFLARELDLPKRQIPYIHRNQGHEKKEEITDYNLKQLNQFYSEHEQHFSSIVKLYKNAKTFPVNNFLDEWTDGT